MKSHRIIAKHSINHKNSHKNQKHLVINPITLITIVIESVRNVEYLLLAMMSELSTVRCDRVLGLWLQVHGRRVSTESCRGGAVADGPCGGRR